MEYSYREFTQNGWGCAGIFDEDGSLYLGYGPGYDSFEIPDKEDLELIASLLSNHFSALRGDNGEG